MGTVDLVNETSCMRLSCMRLSGNARKHESDVRAVLLMGGKGTRLAPYTTVLPKPLIPIDDVPIAEILIRQLRRAGITDITFAVGHLAALIEAYFGDGSRWGVK